MFSTMLTKRRAVDHCRVHSALCRPSWRDAPASFTDSRQRRLSESDQSRV